LKSLRAEKADVERQKLELEKEIDLLKVKNQAYEQQGNGVERLLSESRLEIEKMRSERDRLIVEIGEVTAQNEDFEHVLEAMNDELDTMHEKWDAREKQVRETVDASIASKEQVERELREAEKFLLEHAEEIRKLKDKDFLGNQLERMRSERNSAVEENKCLRNELGASKKSYLECNLLLKDLEENFEGKLVERITSERESKRVTDEENLVLKESIESERFRLAEVEASRDIISKDLEEALNWKSVYEKGHGMQELARSQTSLRGENRRLGIAVEEYAKRLGQAIDENGIILYSFEKLKSETGFGDDFVNFEELQLEMYGDNARLRGEALELESQVETLESQIISLRKDMKFAAGAQEGAQGTGAKYSFDFESNQNESRVLAQDNSRLRREIILLKSFRFGDDCKVHIDTSIGGETQPKAEVDDLKSGKVIESHFSVFRTALEDIMKILRLNENTKDSPNGQLRELIERLFKKEDLLMEKLEKVDAFTSLSSSHPNIQNEEFTGKNKEYPVSMVSSGPTLEPNSSEIQVNTVSQICHGTTPSTSIPLPHQAPKDWIHIWRGLRADLCQLSKVLDLRTFRLRIQSSKIKRLHTQLAERKQALSYLYHDFKEHSDSWKRKEMRYLHENKTLRERVESLNTQLNQYSGDKFQRVDYGTDFLKSCLSEAKRKAIVHESNASILSRRYMNLIEQMRSDKEVQRRIAGEFLEFATTFSRRVVNLEQCKLVACRTISSLQHQLGLSYPKVHIDWLRNLLENLKTHHIETLKEQIRHLESEASESSEVRSNKTPTVVNAGINTFSEDTLSVQKVTQSMEVELQNAKIEIERHKRLADVAINQAESLRLLLGDGGMVPSSEYDRKSFKLSHDDLALGRLQRQLHAIKIVHRSFLKKYRFLKAKYTESEKVNGGRDGSENRNDDVRNQNNVILFAHMRGVESALDNFLGSSRGLSPKLFKGFESKTDEPNQYASTLSAWVAKLHRLVVDARLEAGRGILVSNVNHKGESREDLANVVSSNGSKTADYSWGNYFQKIWAKEEEGIFQVNKVAKRHHSQKPIIFNVKDEELYRKLLFTISPSNEKQGENDEDTKLFSASECSESNDDTKNDVGESPIKDSILSTQVVGTIKCGPTNHIGIRAEPNEYLFRTEQGRNAYALKAEVAGFHSKEIRDSSIASIRTLQDLLVDKNREINMYREKIKCLIHERGKFLSDHHDHAAEYFVYRKDEGLGPPSVSTTVKPTGVFEIDETKRNNLVHDLERRIDLETAQRIRAEKRCGMIMKEMESMKHDLVSLSYVLQLNQLASPALRSELSYSTMQSKIFDASGKGKRIYRKIILKLKDEFMKLQEKDAHQSKEGNSHKEADASGAHQRNALNDLRAQIGLLRDGLSQAKKDILIARRSRDKVAQTNKALSIELNRLEHDVGRVEGKNTILQETLARCRTDLEQSHEKYAQLRNRIKEGADLTSRRRMPNLSRQRSFLDCDLDTVVAQNEILRSSQKLNEWNVRAADVAVEQGKLNRGNLDGTLQPRLSTVGSADRTMRVKQLEQRLTDKSRLLSEANDVIRHLQQSSITKEQPHASTDFSETEKKVFTGDIASTAVNHTIRQLREELQIVQRRNDDLQQEIKGFRHNEMYLRDRIKELELLGDGGSGDRTVFDKLKSKIESDRRQRLDLEAAVLDRDNTCIEMKHELDLKNQEILNMKRIIESDTKRPTRILHRELTAVRGKNLEATVKTLEEVVQKLRLDNENLCRRLASSGVEMKAQKDESFGLTKRASVAEQEVIQYLRSISSTHSYRTHIPDQIHAREDAKIATI
jgi:hypothetical protein